MFLIGYLCFSPTVTLSVKGLYPHCAGQLHSLHALKYHCLLFFCPHVASHSYGYGCVHQVAVIAKSSLPLRIGCAYLQSNDGAWRRKTDNVPSRAGLEKTWHAAFTAVTLFYFFCPTSISILWRICGYIYTHTHTSDCVKTLYELLLLPNNTAVKHFYTHRERCEVLTGYLTMGRWSGGEWASTWHWT